MTLTPEQQKRIAENRQRALKLKELREQLQHKHKSEVNDLTQDESDTTQMSPANIANTYNNNKRANNHSTSSFSNKRHSCRNSPSRCPDDDDIDYDDMEDSLRFQLDLAPIYDGESTSVMVNGKELNKEEEFGDELQMKSIQLASEGKNIFLTGRAGTGKSWVTKKIVNKFYKDNKIIHVTAPTGIAAINVGGITINSWGNYQLGEYYDDFDNMWEKKTLNTIRRMDTLLIDEISMLDGHTFDVLECMVSILRCYDRVDDRLKQIKATAGSRCTMSDLMLQLRWDSNSHLGLGILPPFGGMQLIVVGDFHQLSPVPNGIDVLMANENLTEGDYHLKIGRQGAYAFESLAWRRIGFHTIELKEVHRQVEDDGLLSFLNAMREGEEDLVSKHQETLQHLKSPIIDYGDGIVPTELHSKNYVVDKRNKDELQKLPGDIVEFISTDEVDFETEYKERVLGKYGLAHLAHESTSRLIESKILPVDARSELKRDYELLTKYARETFFEKGCRVNDFYEMKKDAQVMLLWNLDLSNKLANGSRGVISGFFPAEGYNHLIDKEIERRNHKELEREQSSRMDGSDKPNVKNEPNQKITDSDASSKNYDFSRVNSDFVEKVTGFLCNSSDLFLSHEREEMRVVLHSSKIILLPYVQFTDIGGKNAIRERVIRPQAFTKKYRKVGLATRWQIPLVSAWAISIHKSQGLTIERLLVDLADCFAVGQAYVACSRGKDLMTMTIKNFKPAEIKTSEKVKKFYQSLSNGGEPYTSTWRDTIAEFDRCAKEELQKQKDMNASHNNTPCQKCSRICMVRQIQSNRNSNRGKWYIACPQGDKRDGHTWEFVNTMPLLANNAGPSIVSGNLSWKMFIPGKNGTIPDVFLGKQFCLTGVFPELGGGTGLKLGKDKMKELLNKFGGTVTSSISGKTDYVITGLEPGVKRLEDAASKGITVLDCAALREILMGGDLPATRTWSNLKTGTIFKSSKNDDDFYDV